MSLKEFFLKVIFKIKPIRNWSRKYMRKSVEYPIKRKKLNRLYNQFTYREKMIFHSLYAKIFTENGIELQDKAEWTVQFVDKPVVIPLNQDQIWLNWDSALSILGHDIEIKEFYEKILKSKHKPNCFFDIGANYGTHSLLFKIHNVETYSFEPNPYCQNYYQELLELNGLEGNLIGVGLGAEKGEATLKFMANETWNGRLDTSEINVDRANSDVMNIKVQIESVDAFTDETGKSPELIKIDTEGFELNVLMGAAEYIKNNDTIIIFESIERKDRKRIHTLLKESGYYIFELNKKQMQLEPQDFINSGSTNFIAINDRQKLNEIYNS